MNGRDRERRRLFLATFQPLFYWPSDTMAVKCWRAARERLTDLEVDALISTMVTVHNRAVAESQMESHRQRSGGRSEERSA